MSGDDRPTKLWIEKEAPPPSGGAQYRAHLCALYCAPRDGGGASFSFRFLFKRFIFSNDVGRDIEA